MASGVLGHTFPSSVALGQVITAQQFADTGITVQALWDALTGGASAVSFKGLVVDGTGGLPVTPVARTITVTGGGLTIDASATTFTHGVTISATGLTITSGGITISAGGIQQTGGLLSLAGTTADSSITTTNGHKLTITCAGGLFLVSQTVVQSQLYLQGGVRNQLPANKTANYQVLITDTAIAADTSGGAVTLTLPDLSLGASAWAGWSLIVMWPAGFGAHALSIAGHAGTETFNNNAGPFTPGATNAVMFFITDGTNWYFK